MTDHARHPLRGTQTTPLAACATPGARQATLPGEPVSVRAARQFTRAALPGCPRAADLAQAATELAANAVLWSAAGEGGTFTITIRTAPRWARIEVTDPGPARHPAAVSNGRGLVIVASLADRTGTTHGPGRARTTWAEVTWPGSGQPGT